MGDVDVDLNLLHVDLAPIEPAVRNLDDLDRNALMHKLKSFGKVKLCLYIVGLVEGDRILPPGQHLGGGAIVHVGAMISEWKSSGQVTSKQLEKHFGVFAIADFLVYLSESRRISFPEEPLIKEQADSNQSEETQVENIVKEEINFEVGPARDVEMDGSFSPISDVPHRGRNDSRDRVCSRSRSSSRGSSIPRPSHRRRPYQRPLKPRRYGY